MPECIFCQIVNHDINTEIVYEDENVIVFPDINPQAPLHMLVVTKKHIASFAEVDPDDVSLLQSFVKATQRICSKHGINHYRMLTNVGSEAGQTIPHLHWHILSGTRFSRRHAREAALKALFELEFRQEGDTQEILSELFQDFDLLDADHDFAERLVKGVKDHYEEIDETLQQFTRNWKIKRLGRIERSILRMALYELLWGGGNVPPAVTINEAIELTKAYCAPEASSFVNGILDNILQHLQALKSSQENEANS